MEFLQSEISGGFAGWRGQGAMTSGPALLVARRGPTLKGKNKKLNIRFLILSKRKKQGKESTHLN